MDDLMRGSVSGHGSILGFGALEKVKNHCHRPTKLNTKLNTKLTKTIDIANSEHISVV